MPVFCHRRRLAAALLSLGPWLAPAWAHDSWLSPSRLPPQAALVQLELTTGTRYPAQEFNPTAASLRTAQCRDGAGRGFELRPGRDEERALQLSGRRPASPLSGQWSCWAEIQAFEIELTPALVQVYLDEIRAPDSVRANWAALQQRQLPWRESYRKFARAEWREAAEGAAAVPVLPTGMDLEIVLLGDPLMRPGDARSFQVLRDGQPLAGLAIELISGQLRYARWGSTDADGRVSFVLPFAGPWLVRGTDLRLASDRPDTWVSRFATLSLEVAPALRRP